MGRAVKPFQMIIQAKDLRFSSPPPVNSRSLKDRQPIMKGMGEDMDLGAMKRAKLAIKPDKSCRRNRRHGYVILPEGGGFLSVSSRSIALSSCLTSRSSGRSSRAFFK